MAKTIRRALLALAALVASIGVALQAEATTADVGWVQSRPIIGTNGSAFTSGPFVYSTVNGHVYMVTNAHPFHDCQSCPVMPPTVRFRFEGSSTNFFTTADLVAPTNPLYAYYDIRLVDFGPAESTVGDTHRGHNYCTEHNCTAAFGQGSAANANWAGTAIDIASADNAVPGTPVHVDKAVSGSSTGTVERAVSQRYQGWDYWAVLVQGVSHCGLTHGDSGSGVRSGGVLLGVVTAFGLRWWEEHGNACYSGTRYVSDSLLYVGWYDIQHAWSGLGLVPVTTP